MKLSEFHRAVTEEFGEAYGHSLLRDMVLGEFGDLTAEQAIAAGFRARDIWVALCRANDIPENRRYGAGLRKPT